MSEQQELKLVTINIDGETLKVPQGTNIIEAAASIKTEIPYYCYHPKLTVAGNCRMCMVEMGMPMRDRATGELLLDDEGKAKIGWMPKPAIACGTQAAEGMHIRTKTDAVKNFQSGVMELLLLNHPLDCPICDQAGECRLQEFATDYGRGISRFIEPKNVKPKRTALGPRVTLDDERCILCSRCIRFCQEVVKDDVLGFVDRGSYSTLTCYPGKELANNYSLNTVDLCPVGALTSTDFRFKMRVWFLKRTKSICTESSVGVNTEVWSREGKIYRITPRRNDCVNDTWMADSGRELYKAVESETRLTAYKSNGNKVSAQEAYLRLVEIIPTGKTAYVISGHMSVEEQYMFAQLAALHPGPIYAVKHQQAGDGLLISEDRTPNIRGALLTGLLKELPTENLKALSAQIDAGEIKNVLVCREDLIQHGLDPQQLKKINVIYLGTHQNETEAVAKIAIPTLTVFEKSGSFVNQQFRVQKFEQAVPGPVGVLPDLLSFQHILGLFTHSQNLPLSLGTLWEKMSGQISAFQGMRYESIPEVGEEINAAAFAHLPFPETKSLHYNAHTRSAEKQEALSS